ncbi:MAG: glycosyltransferase family 9 protein [Desulfobulbaceae bacterium]|nr:glycosyltransferase family 9 protein [Candidatus Kapabacteria bacterium]MBS3999428.1 glycosyltransferase family 9 protein [Desulfobulbaceae bacterium]
MKAMVVQLGRIGDLILLTPMFEVLKEQYSAEVTLLVGPSNYSIIKGHPAVDKVIVLDKAPHKLTPTMVQLLIKRFDVWLDPRDHFSTEGRLLAKIGRAKMKIGFNPQSKKSVFTHNISNENRYLHQVQVGLNALQPLGYELSNEIPRPTLPVNSNSEQKIEEFIGNQENKFTLLNISASKDDKMWHEDLWVKFINTQSKQIGELVICHAPNHTGMANSIVSKLVGNVKVYCSPEISDIVSLIKRAELLISPDTSLVHIAAAFNIPVLALYSGLDDFYTKFCPLSEIQISVRADKGDTGLKSITLDSLNEAFTEMLKKLSK